MRLHLPGIPHTETTLAFSHCAFTQKVLKFIPMMRAQGYDVIHYGVGDQNPGATEHVQLMTVVEQQTLMCQDGFVTGPMEFVGNKATIGSPHYNVFNERLTRELHARVEFQDLVCLPFGRAHESAVFTHAGQNVESGIGYPECFLPFRIYESYSWESWHAGNDKIPGSDYHWVIPNYFDVTHWPLGTGPRKYLAYFGRIGALKGLDIVKEIAKARPDLDVLVCGQGDPTPWLDPAVPNLKYESPKVGTDRAAFLGGAIALLAPSRFYEPFCGVTVEANLCGTPALTSAFGAFAETVQDGMNGWKCRTLGDWLAAIRWAEKSAWHPDIRYQARQKYSLTAIGPQYTRVFQQIADLRDHGAKGWYSSRSAIA